MIVKPGLVHEVWTQHGFNKSRMPVLTKALGRAQARASTRVAVGLPAARGIARPFRKQVCCSASTDPAEREHLQSTCRRPICDYPTKSTRKHAYIPTHATNETLCYHHGTDSAATTPIANRICCTIACTRGSSNHNRRLHPCPNSASETISLLEYR